MPYGTFDRDENLAALDDGTYDVLVAVMDRVRVAISRHPRGARTG